MLRKVNVTLLSKSFLIFLYFLTFQLFNFQTLFAQSRFEIDVSAGYSQPLFESYGTNVIIVDEDKIFIDGKGLIKSDNFGTDVGYTVQVLGKYSLLKAGYVKVLMNIGYNRLYSIHAGPAADYGVRIQSFSVGTGIELSPMAKFKITPSIFGLLRYNLVGGESYYHAGLDFFKAASRFGYSAGLKLGYRLNNNIGLFSGWSYNYDNLWNKETNPDPQYDAHTIPFRDKPGDNNSLTHDRRIAYWSALGGITFYLR